MTRSLQLIQPGLVTFAAGLELQQQARQIVSEGQLAGVLILLEHHPVITFGRSGGRENLVLPCARRSRQCVEFVDADRGGNVTCHNPGQLVIYPVINLKFWQEDVHWYVEQLEEVLIKTLKVYGLIAGRKARYTGVWMGNRKIAAIGVNVRRWITGHGAALNVDNDLTLFQQIVPCGIQEFGVTSIHSLGVVPSMESVSQELVNCFAEVFDVTVKKPKEA